MPNSLTISFSLDSIDPEEILVRRIYSPEHLKEDQSLKSTFIPSQDIRESTRGLSMDRKAFVKRENIAQNILEYLQKHPENTFFGFAIIKCKEILGIKDNDGNQAFEIQSRPTEKNKSHAVILCSKKYPPSAINMLREKLINKFDRIDTLDELFA